jgi:hypothetical protein
MNVGAKVLLYRIEKGATFFRDVLRHSEAPRFHQRSEESRVERFSLTRLA